MFIAFHASTVLKFPAVVPLTRSDCSVVVFAVNLWSMIPSVGSLAVSILSLPCKGKDVPDQESSQWFCFTSY